MSTVILLANGKGTRFKSNYKDIPKPLIKYKDDAHLKILRNTPINIITKEHSPLYGNLKYFNISQKH